MKHLKIKSLGLLISSITMLLSGIKSNKLVQTHATDFTNLGECTITDIRTINPFGASSSNEFVAFFLGNTDYPTDASTKISNAKFDYTLLDAASLKLGGNNAQFVNSEIHVNFGGVAPAFVMCLAGSGSVNEIIVKKGFKIPSYSYLSGGAASYYTVNDNYTAERLTKQHSSSSWDTWNVQVDLPTNAKIAKLETMVDGTREFLTFTLSGSGVDYPAQDGFGNCAFSASLFSTILPNFTSKVHLYDANNEVITTSIGALVSIDLWTRHSIISVELDNLSSATRVIIDEGLILPSYARYTNDTSSAVYGGFTIKGDYVFDVPTNAKHNYTGAINVWVVADLTKDLGTLGLKSLFTENPYGNMNEFITLTFNKDTDFKSSPETKISNTKYGIFQNYQDYIEVYYENGSKLANNLIDAYFNYHSQNSISFMLAGCGNGVKIVLKQGLIIPSYAYYSGSTKDDFYGTYTLDKNYTYYINSGHTHTAGSVNQWSLPSCNVYYYDVNNNLLNDLTSKAECGSEYVLEAVPSKKGYSASWTVVEPTSLTINNNRVITPDTPTDIKFKVSYEVRSYVLSFEGLTTTIDVTYNQPINTELPAVPEVAGKTGYWTINGEKITSETIWIYDENQTALKTYEDRVVTISFDSNGGSEVDPIDLLYGESVNKLPTPEKEGYIFVCWCSDIELNNEYDVSSIVTGDITLYAKWNIKYLVSFDTNGGSTVDSYYVCAGSTLSNIPTPTREGYEFTGWRIGSEKYSDGYVVNSDVTLVATWKEIPTEEEKSGCGGNILATSLIISLVSILGIGLIVLKKKEQ